MRITVMMIIEDSHDLDQALGTTWVFWSLHWVTNKHGYDEHDDHSTWYWQGTVDIWNQFTECEWLVSCSLQGKSMSMSFKVTEGHLFTLFPKGCFFTIQWKVNFQKVWKLTFHQLVKNIQIEIPLQTGRGVNHGSDLCCNCRQAEAAACSVTLRSLHGPGSNFCHPPAHGEHYNKKFSWFLL